MVSTDIKQVLELKRKGEKIIFLDCPICRCFFGTNDSTDITCSQNCKTKLAQKKEQLEAYKNALIAFRSDKKNSSQKINPLKKNQKLKNNKFIHFEFEGVNY